MPLSIYIRTYLSQVIAGPIPYATLFGRRERVLSLQSYVEHPEYGMRAYSHEHQNGSSSSSSSAFSPVTAGDPPLYIFSGPEQVLYEGWFIHPK